MTYSVIVRDEATGRVGIGVATRFLAVGAAVPRIETGHGGIAGQAFIRPCCGRCSLAMLREGRDANTVIATLTASDDGCDHRQLHVMDAKGNVAAHTGASCVDLCGHLIRPTLSVASSMPAGSEVIVPTAHSYEANLQLPFARRLILAMQAGKAAGGDKRGKQSIALLVHDGKEYPVCGIRVDDHPEPVSELTRPCDVARQRYVHFRRRMPSQTAPAGNAGRNNMGALGAPSIAEGRE